MSDCSTNAMKPKKSPKTNSFPNGLWPNKGDCHTCAKTGHCEYEQFGERITTARCEYKPSAYHILEQRYQQLEQVAKSVSHSIGILMDDETVKKMPMLYLCMNKMHCQLEIALGVSLDD